MWQLVMGQSAGCLERLSNNPALVMASEREAIYLFVVVVGSKGLALGYRHFELSSDYLKSKVTR